MRPKWDPHWSLFHPSTSDKICHLPLSSLKQHLTKCSFGSKSPRDERASKEALQHQVRDLNSNVTRDEISQNRFI